MTLLSYPIPNLIGGVSQQAAAQRRDIQAEEQINIINSPVDGAVARPPSRLVRHIPGVTIPNTAFLFFLQRSSLEEYAVAIYSGDMRIWNLLTGDEATIAFPNGKAYLGTGSLASADTFRYATVEDYTYISNKTIVPALNSGDTAPARPYEALVYFRAGNFLETYSVTVGAHTWTLTTVDNAATANSAYVKTNFLAQRMYTLMTGGVPANVSSYSGPGDIRTLIPGMTISVQQSTVYLSRPVANGDFSISTNDGAANAGLRAIKDRIQKFGDLPRDGVAGFTIQVAGDQAAIEDDYWVTFKETTGGGNATGIWEEVPKPGTILSFNNDTMPWQLVSLGTNSFRFERGTWAKRVSGDGIKSAADPEFVGEAIQDLFLHRNRLGILTNSSVSFSEPRQFYTYFPKSAQTVLSTDPISVLVTHRRPALLRDALAYNEQLLLWADKVQFSVNSDDVFDAKSIDVQPSTEFEYNPVVRPVGIGSNIYFSSINGQYSRVWEYFVTDQGLAKDANPISSQVPSYIPATIRGAAGSASLSCLVFWDGASRNRLWVYNFFVSGEEKLQSAWNIWEFDTGSRILHAGFSQSELRMLVQRVDANNPGLSIETINFQPVQTDTGMDLLVRLDRRMATSQFSSLTYNASTDETSFVLPTWVTGGDLKVVAGPGNDIPAGAEFSIVSANPVSRQVVVEGRIDAEDVVFAGWLPPPTVLELSPFWPKDANGIAIPFERIQLKYLTVVHSATGYYRIETSMNTGKTYSSEFSGRVLGDPSNVFDKIIINDGQFRRPIKSDARKVRIKLVNDSYLPSAWQAAEYQYQVTQRSVRGGR